MRDSGTSKNDSFVPGTDTLRVEGAMLSRSPNHGDTSQVEGAMLSRSPNHGDTSQVEGAMLSQSSNHSDIQEQDEGALLLTNKRDISPSDGMLQIEDMGTKASRAKGMI